MNKKKLSFTSILLSAVVIVACAVLLLVLSDYVFKNVTGRSLPWWAYLTIAAIYALIVYLIYLLIGISKQRFERLLAREGVCTDKVYESDGQKLYVDFASKRIADTYLSTKPIVRFDEVVGFRVECFQTGSKRVLSDDRRFLSVVLTLRKSDPTADSPYLYLPMFETEVDAADVPDEPDVTEEMVAKYPELQPLYDLKTDVVKILELNKSDSDKNVK